MALLEVIVMGRFIEHLLYAKLYDFMLPSPFLINISLPLFFKDLFISLREHVSGGWVGENLKQAPHRAWSPRPGT